MLKTWKNLQLFSCLLHSSGVVLFCSFPLNNVKYFIFISFLLISGTFDIILHDSWQHRLSSVQYKGDKSSKYQARHYSARKTFFYNTMTLFLARHIYRIFLRTLWTWNLWMYGWFYDPQLILMYFKHLSLSHAEIVQFLPAPAWMSQKSPKISLKGECHDIDLCLKVKTFQVVFSVYGPMVFKVFQKLFTTYTIIIFFICFFEVSY